MARRKQAQVEDQAPVVSSEQASAPVVEQEQPKAKRERKAKAAPVVKEAKPKAPRFVTVEDEEGNERMVVNPDGYRCKQHGPVEPYVCGSYRRCPICTKERVERWKARKAEGKLGVWTASSYYREFGGGREDGKRAVLKTTLITRVGADPVKEDYRQAELGRHSA